MTEGRKKQRGKGENEEGQERNYEKKEDGKRKVRVKEETTKGREMERGKEREEQSKSGNEEKEEKEWEMYEREIR